jgi:hypothetical protein
MEMNKTDVISGCHGVVRLEGPLHMRLVCKTHGVRGIGQCHAHGCLNPPDELGAAHPTDKHHKQLSFDFKGHWGAST